MNDWDFVRKCPGNLLESCQVGFVDTLFKVGFVDTLFKVQYHSGRCEADGFVSNGVASNSDVCITAGSLAY